MPDQASIGPVNRRNLCNIPVVKIQRDASFARAPARRRRIPPRRRGRLQPRFNPALGYALAISRAQGSRIYDVTGKEYIDFNLAHGAAFLGTRAPRCAPGAGCRSGQQE